MDSDIHFDYHLSGRSPFIRTLHEFTPDTIKFEGYFYLEDETMPVERILVNKNVVSHVEILQKITYDDTSNSTTDNEELYNGDPEDNVVFFPTAMIELKYRVIKVLETMEEITQVRDRIQVLDVDVEARNEPFKRAREDRENEAMIELCKNIDYKSMFANMDNSKD